MPLRLLLTLLILYPCWLDAQPKVKRRAITEMYLAYDTSRATEFYNTFPINLHIKRHNGKEKILKGSDEGTWQWNKFNISVDNGDFSAGQIYFDWKQVYHHGHQIILHVSPKNNAGLQAQFRIPIPYLTSIAFQFDSTTSLIPGFAFPIELLAYYSNGRVYSTVKPSLEGHVLSASHFKIHFNGYSSQQGSLFLPTTLQPYPEQTLVRATYQVDTSITAQVSLPVRYKAQYTLNFIAEDGLQGRSGNDASGCQGRNGRDGQHGQNGQKGQRGKTIQLYAQALGNSSDTLIQIKALSPTQTEHLLLDPQGRLSINCKGGNGGNGGKGGNGSNGQDETETEAAGYGGHGGHGGNGGDGGDGGKVIIYTDSVALPLVERILTVENSGGKGGQGGKGGKRGKGGYKNPDNSIWTALGNLVGVGSGESGSSGYQGQDGEDGLEQQVIVIPSEKLKTFF